MRGEILKTRAMFKRIKHNYGQSLAPEREETNTQTMWQEGDAHSVPRLIIAHFYLTVYLPMTKICYQNGENQKKSQKSPKYKLHQAEWMLTHKTLQLHLKQPEPKFYYRNSKTRISMGGSVTFVTPVHPERP